MIILQWLRFIIAAALILSGLFIMVSATIGNYKFKFVLNRMHSAAMGDTLGILFMMLGLIVFSGLNFTSVKLLLIIIFLWISSPVTSHLLVRLEVTTDEDVKDECEEITE